MSEAPETVIEFRRVSFRAANAHLLLSDLSLSVRRGETLVLLGRSGSGKTTTLKLINRLLEPSAGEVQVEGRSTLDVGSHSPAPKHRLCHPGSRALPALHGGTKRWLGAATWNVGRRRKSTRGCARCWNLVGLPPEQFLSRYPRELSGGQRQRVGVARALAGDPPLLLMDEPFGALDPLTRAEIQREFLALQKRLQKTIIFVTHDMREALLLGTRIALLEAGKLVGVFTPDEFLHAPDPIVAAYVAAFRAGDGKSKL